MESIHRISNKRTVVSILHYWVYLLVHSVIIEGFVCVCVCVLGHYQGGGSARKNKEEQERRETEKSDEELAIRIHAQENSYRPAQFENRKPVRLPSREEELSSASTSAVSGVSRGDRPMRREDDSERSSRESAAGLAQRDGPRERDQEMANSANNAGRPGQEHWVDAEEQLGTNWPTTSSGTAHRPDAASGLSLGDQPGRFRSPPQATRETETSEMEKRDAMMAMEMFQREQEYVKKIEVDRKLAEQMQQTEDRDRRVEEGTRHEEDRRLATGGRAHTEWPEYGQGGDGLGVARRLLSKSAEESYNYNYNQEVLMNEEPRPKTPEERTKEEGKVPCQYCTNLFPFSGIMDHQVALSETPAPLTPLLVCLLLFSFYRNIARGMDRVKQVKGVKSFSPASGSQV